CNLDQQCKAPDLLTFGDCGRTSVAEFVGRMTKTTREESDGPRHFAIPKRAKRKGKMAGQRGPIAPTQGVPP
ncbi:unnamed protein product, partial [Ascophyllum nodosum]